MCLSTVLKAIAAAWLFASCCFFALAAPVRLEEQRPVSIVQTAPGNYLLDFGRVAFGNLLLSPGASAGKGEVTVRFGESLRDGRIDQTPPGSVRYAEVKVKLARTPEVVSPAADARNTRPPAVLTSAALGVLIPFRWVEISGWPGQLLPGQIVRRAVFDSTWNDRAASFNSSDEMLNRIWELSHYSIKATTFAGVFVDGDRERIAYEADAYLTQLSYYAGNPHPQMARDTFERLMQFPTWPSEWAPHMVFMAYADWMQTADKDWLANHYEWLKTKTLAERVGADGLVHSTPAQIHRADLVDWPTGERDDYVFTELNTVVNAFHLRAVKEMRQLALALGKQADADLFAHREQEGRAAFQQILFDKDKGLYRDGVHTDHTSLHANLFPLAFGLVPEARRDTIARWLSQQGMRCSVYAAQYLLEALFENGYGEAAVNEMMAPGDRSWRHMVESGATITWEAWDQKYKPNQDWNHAWGAAPANLLPRFVLGLQVAAPGWKEVVLQPHTSGLRSASGDVPTSLGTAKIAWNMEKEFRMEVDLPRGMMAQVRLPAAPDSRGVWRDGHAIAAVREGDYWILRDGVKGRATLVVR